jgi:hypothetical protein
METGERAVGNVLGLFELLLGLLEVLPRSFRARMKHLTPRSGHDFADTGLDLGLPDDEFGAAVRILVEVEWRQWRQWRLRAIPLDRTRQRCCFRGTRVGARRCCLLQVILQANQHRAPKNTDNQPHLRYEWRRGLVLRVCLSATRSRIRFLGLSMAWVEGFHLVLRSSGRHAAGLYAAREKKPVREERKRRVCSLRPAIQQPTTIVCARVTSLALGRSLCATHRSIAQAR